MVVADETAEGTFVCFDGVMMKLHNLRASEAGQMLVRYTSDLVHWYHITVTD